MTDYFGKHRGTVTDTDDPQGEGRVRVDVPSAGVSNEWAAACVPGRTRKRGCSGVCYAGVCK